MLHYPTAEVTPRIDSWESWWSLEGSLVSRLPQEEGEELQWLLYTSLIVCQSCYHMPNQRHRRWSHSLTSSCTPRHLLDRKTPGLAENTTWLCSRNCSRWKWKKNGRWKESKSECDWNERQEEKEREREQQEFPRLTLAPSSCFTQTLKREACCKHSPKKRRSWKGRYMFLARRERDSPTGSR